MRGAIHARACLSIQLLSASMVVQGPLCAANGSCMYLHVCNSFSVL